MSSCIQCLNRIPVNHTRCPNNDCVVVRIQCVDPQAEYDAYMALQHGKKAAIAILSAQFKGAWTVHNNHVSRQGYCDDTFNCGLHDDVSFAEPNPAYND